MMPISIPHWGHFCICLNFFRILTAFLPRVMNSFCYKAQIGIKQRQSKATGLKPTRYPGQGSQYPIIQWKSRLLPSESVIKVPSLSFSSSSPPFILTSYKTILKARHCLTNKGLKPIIGHSQKMRVFYLPQMSRSHARRYE